MAHNDEKMTRAAIEHWRRNLERFPPGHIGHEHAKAALARLESSVEPGVEVHERAPGEDDEVAAQ